MRALLRCLLAAALWAAAPSGARGAEQDVDAPSAPVAGQDVNEAQETGCTTCHGDSDLWEQDTQHLWVTADDLAMDIHWQKDIRCHDCHGGNAETLNLRQAHAVEDGFHKINSPADMAGFCGRCHSDIEYMRGFQPSPRTDQESEYWTSGHGQRLRKTMEDHQRLVESLPAGQELPAMEDPQVATCLPCHTAGGRHQIRAVNDLKSTVYPTHVAETCATCHANSQLMEGLTYHDRPLGHSQYEQWKQSVHGQALLKKGDLSAPTCNDCHGNHGAVPPDVDSVANACGTCHGKVAALFAETRMKHQFDVVGLPGCAACHGNHQTISPADQMLGMEGDAVCARCHTDQRHGATLAGASTARTMRLGLENLKEQIALAEEKIGQAERLGMEVRGPRFDLRQAREALTNARSLVHGFAVEPVQQTLVEGSDVAATVTERAEGALAEHTRRRIWLAVTVLPILAVVGLLLLYIRALPLPASTAVEP